jgi:hypothetical protein
MYSRLDYICNGGKMWYGYCLQQRKPMRASHSTTQTNYYLWTPSRATRETIKSQLCPPFPGTEFSLYICARRFQPIPYELLYGRMFLCLGLRWRGLLVKQDNPVLRQTDLIRRGGSDSARCRMSNDQLRFGLGGLVYQLRECVRWVGARDNCTQAVCSPYGDGIVCKS